VRWREDRQGAEFGKGEVQRSRSFATNDEALEFSLRLNKDLRKKGHLMPAHDPSPPPPPPALVKEVTLDEVLAAWQKWASGSRKLRTATTEARHHGVGRWLRALRLARGLPDSAPVPLAVLGLDAFVDANSQLHLTNAESTTYQAAAAVHAMWEWAWDIKKWPSCPEPPRDSTLVLPRTVSWAAPSMPAHNTEVDAVLRRLVEKHRGSYHHRGPYAHRMAIIARYTGLRLLQVAMLHREDLDLDNGWIIVRHGKTKREHALQRGIPIHPGLMNDLGQWLHAAQPGPLFPGRKDPTKPLPSYRNPTRWVSEAWQECIAAGEVRPGVFRPPNREKNQPNHVYRAFLQAALARARVERHLIDWLVGHAGGVREQHYVGPPENDLEEAIRALPAVNWMGAPPDEALPNSRLRLVK
jgi:integrase